MADARPAERVLTEEIREHRVYHEVYRESAVTAEGKRTLAVEVRVWAMLPRGSSTLPGSAAFAAAVLALQRVAGAVCPRDRSPLADVEPFRSALYDSRQVPGCDEIYLALAVRADAAEPDGGEAGRERRAKELTHRLEVVGVYPGAWREPHGHGHGPGHDESGWRIQPLAEVGAAPAA